MGCDTSKAVNSNYVFLFVSRSLKIKGSAQEEYMAPQSKKILIIRIISTGIRRQSHAEVEAIPLHYRAYSKRSLQNGFADFHMLLITGGKKGLKICSIDRLSVTKQTIYWDVLTNFLCRAGHAQITFNYWEMFCLKG